MNAGNHNTTAKPANWHIVFMTLSMFMTGASGMVIEYVLSTVSSYLNGSQIESFSLTIAIMMGMMGIGGWAQRFVSDENIIDKFVYLEILLAVISAFSPIAVYAAFSYTPEHFQFVYYFFAMSIGFLVGFEIPFITRANETYTKRLSDNLSIVFAADYLGAFFGALVWVYFLLPHMNIAKISFTLAALNFAVAILTYIYFKRETIFKTDKLISLGMGFAAFLLLYGFNNVINWTELVEQKMYPDPIVASVKTPYQQLTITHNSRTNDTRLYINGNTQFSSLDEVRYHESLVHTAIGTLEQLPQKALVLGGGDGLAARELKKYPGINIDLVELDQDMFNWSRSQPLLTSLNNNSFADFNEYAIDDYKTLRDTLINLDDTQKHRVFFTDANNFINAYIQNRLTNSYDVIIIDLPDPYSLGINKMYTEQFYKRLYALLNEDGVIVTQATSPFHAPLAFATIGKTIESAGFNAKPYHYNIPSFGEWGWWLISGNEITFKSLHAKTSYLTNELAAASFNFGKNELITGDSVESNTLMHPILVRIYNTESWLVD